MRKVLIEKYEPFSKLLFLLDEIRKKGFSTDDTILFCSKDVLIYRLNSCFKIKPNGRKQYEIRSSKIASVCVYKIPDILLDNTELRNKIDCVKLKSRALATIPISKNFMLNHFSNDNTLSHYQPSKFIEENEEKIINLIFKCNCLLKEIFKNINNINEPDVKKIQSLIKQYSDCYKFYRKKIDTSFIMSEKKRIAKENRLLFSCKKFCHPRVSSD